MYNTIPSTSTRIRDEQLPVSSFGNLCCLNRGAVFGGLLWCEQVKLVLTFVLLDQLSRLIREAFTSGQNISTSTKQLAAYTKGRKAHDVI